MFGQLDELLLNTLGRWLYLQVLSHDQQRILRSANRFDAPIEPCLDPFQGEHFVNAAPCLENHGKPQNQAVDNSVDMRNGPVKRTGEPLDSKRAELVHQLRKRAPR